MGYHKTKIPKGVFGEFCKIEEEFLELKDAIEQNHPILELCEIADLVGSIQGYVQKYFGGVITFEDILQMTASTHEAFKEGSRK